MLAFVWVGCAIVIVTAALRSRRHRSALRMGRVGVSVLYFGAGAAVNALFLLRGDDYAKFADNSYIPFVRHTWHTVVEPSHGAWISVLIAFELAVGGLILLGGPRTQLAYVAAIGFHIALLSFGWGFYLWSVPMIAALATLLHAERRAAAAKNAGVARVSAAQAAAATRGAGVELYWIPLGAGHHSVRFNGIIYEAVSAGIQHRTRSDLYHSVLAIELPSGRYMVEMTPVTDHEGHLRGVVREGPVGIRPLGHMRLFRYEIRRWRHGVVPDLEHAVASPVRITSDLVLAQRIFDLVQEVPAPAWGRDELQAGEMWSCNSVTSWTLTAAGVDVRAIPFPPHARAPGWDAGRVIAERREIKARRTLTATAR